MPLAENLIEGFAQAAGAEGAVNSIEKQKADRRATSHEELQANTQSILNDVAGLQQRRASLDPQSPTYQKDLADIDANLHTARQTFTDLYHPEKNPGALDKLGGFIKQHITGRKAIPQNAGQAKASIASTIAGLDTAAAAPGQGMSAEDRLLTPAQRTDAAQIKAGLKPRAQEFKPEAENWVPTTVKLQNGQEVTLQRNSKSGEWTNLDGSPVPKEQLAGASVAPKAAPGGNSKFSQEAGVYEKKWGKPVREWTPEQLSYFNQKMAYDSQHSGQSTTTRLEKDEYGNIRPVEITNTRGPMKPPVEPGSVPTTAGAAKQRMGAPPPRASGPNIKVGDALPFTGSTPAITKAQADLNEATKLSSVADQVAQKPNDAVNQKRLAVALERASAGRFTTQALDYIIKAGWGNTLEQWANNPSTGALPADIMRQLVDGAHQNLQGAKDALATAHGPASGGGGGTTKPTGKAVSFAKAKSLPAMQGKSDDEIRKAIEQSGHQVIP